MRFYLFAILFFFAPTMLLASEKNIKATELFDLIVLRYDLESWKKAKAEFEEKRLKKETAWANPQLEMGWGGAKEGAFRGNYREWSLSQSIPLNGQRSAKQKQIELQKNLSLWQGQQLTHEIHGEVIRMIFFHQYNLERAAHIQERIQRLNNLESYLKNKKFASPKDLVEKAQIQNRIKHLKVEIVHIENDLAQSIGYFKHLAGLKHTTSIQTEWPSIISLERLFLEGLNNTQSIEKQFSTEFKMREIEAQASRSLWIPDLKLYYTQNTQDQAFQDPVIIDAFGLGLSLPVFNWGRSERAQTTAAVTEVLLEQNKNKIVRTSQSLQLRSQFYTAQMTLKEFSVEYINKVDRELDRATSNFKKGLVPAASYLDLEDQVHESLHLISRSKLDLIDATLKALQMNNLEKDLRAEFL